MTIPDSGFGINASLLKACIPAIVFEPPRALASGAITTLTLAVLWAGEKNTKLVEFWIVDAIAALLIDGIFCKGIAAGGIIVATKLAGAGMNG